MGARAPMVPKSPVYVISKGRSNCCLTARALVREGMPFRLVVEEQERDAYAAKFDPSLITVLPVPNPDRTDKAVRNWCWEDALAKGHERHWILDDNISYAYRRWQARSIYCEFGLALGIAEDFVDRYENVAIGGLAYRMMVPDFQRFIPFFLNVHVYSCMLIRNDLPYRWRGRYNKDVDLCLQVLSAGWCTLLLNAFNVKKVASMQMKGGNTASHVSGGRLRMARELERRWPGVVEVKRKFQRPQHSIAHCWRHFDAQLRRKPNYAELVAASEHRMRVEVLRKPESEIIARIAREYAEDKDD